MTCQVYSITVEQFNYSHTTDYDVITTILLDLLGHQLVANSYIYIIEGGDSSYVNFQEGWVVFTYRV